MGVGLGVDVLFSHKNDDWGSDWENPSYGSDRGSTTTAAMIPLFTDFRFNIGGNSGASFFIDMKVGCSFLLGNKYISIGDGSGIFLPASIQRHEDSDQLPQSKAGGRYRDKLSAPDLQLLELMEPKYHAKQYRRVACFRMVGNASLPYTSIDNSGIHIFLMPSYMATFSHNS